VGSVKRKRAASSPSLLPHCHQALDGTRDSDSRTMPLPTCQASGHYVGTTGHRGICRRHLAGAARLGSILQSTRGRGRFARRDSGGTLRHGSGEGIVWGCVGVRTYARTMGGVWTAVARRRSAGDRLVVALLAKVPSGCIAATAAAAAAAAAWLVQEKYDSMDTCRCIEVYRAELSICPSVSVRVRSDEAHGPLHWRFSACRTHRGRSRAGLTRTS
jgi:hypothetical protein